MKVIKIKCKKDGFRWNANLGKCVKMSQDEIKARKKAAKIAVQKRKGKMAQILKKAAITRQKNAGKIQKITKFK
jgi:hypothetical protein